MFEFKAGDMIVGRLHKEPVILKEIADEKVYPLNAGYQIYTKYGYYQASDAEPSIRLATGKQAEIGERPFIYPLYKRWKSDGEIAKFTALCAKEILVKGNQDDSLEVGTVSTSSWAHTNPDWEDCEAPESLYDGLTLAQWGQVVEEKLVCEVWNDGDTIENDVGYLRYVDPIEGETFLFSAIRTDWKHCRIHHSQPQFVVDGKKPDWLDDDDVVSSLDRGGYISIRSAKDVVWCDQVRFQVIAKL